MAQDPIPVPFEAMRPEDVLRLAREILAHTRFGPLVAGLGVYNTFSPEDEQAIGGFMEEFGRREGWGSRHPYNLAIPPALARRLASGVFADIDGADARAFAEHNILKPHRCPPPHVRELLFVTRALDESRHMHAVIRKIIRTDNFRGKDINTWGYFVDKITRTHGMMARSSFGRSLAIMQMLIKGNISSLEDGRLMEHLRVEAQWFDPACTFSGPSNV